MVHRMSTILLTRPQEGADRFAKALTTRLDQPQIMISPVMDIAPTNVVPDLTEKPLLVFTSRNGVRFADIPSGQDCVTVGDSTAEAAVAAGHTAQSAGGDVEDLLTQLYSQNPQRPILHLRGKHSTGDLVKRLRDAGFQAAEQIVYAQRAKKLSQAAITLLNREVPVILPLFSPRSAEEFVQQYKGHARLYVAAISDAVAQAAAPLKVQAMRVAKHPTARDMIECVAQLCDAAEVLERGNPEQ